MLLINKITKQLWYRLYSARRAVRAANRREADVSEAWSKWLDALDALEKAIPDENQVLSAQAEKLTDFAVNAIHNDIDEYTPRENLIGRLLAYSERKGLPDGAFDERRDIPIGTFFLDFSWIEEQRKKHNLTDAEHRRANSCRHFVFFARTYKDYGLSAYQSVSVATEEGIPTRHLP